MIRLQGKDGAELELTEYGAAVYRLLVPDREGKLRDVVWSHEAEESYRERKLSLGAALDGFHTRLWSLQEADAHHASLALFSSDGEGGFSGDPEMTLTVAFDEENCLTLEYLAEKGWDAQIPFANRIFYNLEGHDAGPVGRHRLQIAAHSVWEIDGQRRPAGQKILLEGTAFDFRVPHPLEHGLSQPHENMLAARGFNHCFVLDRGGVFHEAAAVACRESGIAMRVFTDLPGLGLYTANDFDGLPGKDGAFYEQYGAFCLSPQTFPEGVGAPLYKAGEPFRCKTVLRFETFQ